MQLIHHDSDSLVIVRIIYPTAGTYRYIFVLGSGFILNESGSVQKMNEGWFNLVNNLIENDRAEIVS